MTSFTSYEKLKQTVGKEIAIKGEISTTPWQHTIASLKEHPFIEYFDLEDGFQTVLYSKDDLPKGTFLKIRGTVIEVKGRSKRPTDEQDEFREYHIVVKEFQKI